MPAVHLIELLQILFSDTPFESKTAEIEINISALRDMTWTFQFKFNGFSFKPQVYTRKTLRLPVELTEVDNYLSQRQINRKQL